MKTLQYLILILSNLLISCSVTEPTAETSSERPYYVVKKNGEVHIRQNDNIYVVSKESVSLENGYTVSPRGKVDYNNGKKIQLLDGEAMHLNGNKKGEIISAKGLVH
jgi:hypothetical protein